MELLSSILNITMIILLVRAVFSIIAGLMLTNKMKKAKENQVVTREEIEDNKEKLQAHIKSLMVKDDYCGKMIFKENAYIINLNDERHHFCSWDCRQKYIAESA